MFRPSGVPEDAQSKGEQRDGRAGHHTRKGDFMPMEDRQGVRLYEVTYFMEGSPSERHTFPMRGYSAEDVLVQAALRLKGNFPKHHIVEIVPAKPVKSGTETE